MIAQRCSTRLWGVGLRGAASTFEQIKKRDDAEEFLIRIDDEGFADGAAHEGLDEVEGRGFRVG